MRQLLQNTMFVTKYVGTRLKYEKNKDIEA